MKALFVAALGVIFASGSVYADKLPLTTREVALMLRSGYSNETVIQELRKRRFGDLIDVDHEKQLTAAGANAALIEILRSGSVQASRAELEAAEAKLAAAEKEQAEANQRSREVSKSRSEIGQHTQQSTNESHVVHDIFKNRLICLHQGTIAPFDDTELQNKKFYLLFFSANWSPEGRKFTSQLIEYYNRVKAQHPEFEIIFCSADRSQFSMETYYHDSGMPWPAVAYPKINATAAEMDTKTVKSIPALMLIARNGDVVSQTGGDSEPKTAEQVLADVDTVLAYKPKVALSQE